ncbi:MAG: HAMP domain-containing histidine kinase [Planctomycetes bacterium]|nr:HAMP domain-containing histidine kinase [Planctomycetota bacterium]MCB9905398.1 HAMP domain-containing histidine kinase [Planctomycetota bacterium]
MRLSLRQRVFVAVLVVNLLIFGAVFAYVTGRVADDRARSVDRAGEVLNSALASSIGPDGRARIGEILELGYWQLFEDAVVVRANLDFGPRGELGDRAVVLFPLGSVQRESTFEVATIYRSLADAISVGSALEGPHGGVSLPIVDRLGRVWGGCWYQLPDRTGARELLSLLLPWFAATTLLLSLGSFAVLRRSVLDPLERLAEGSQRLAAGEFGVHLEVPSESGEITDLVRSFNQMAAEVRGYHEHLEEEVARATAQAREAEAAVLRERRLAAMGELAAGIAHEINNPLGGMLNAVDVLRRDQIEPEKRRRYHDLLQGGLERIRETVSKLLRLTPRAADDTPFALAEPTRDAVALVAHRAAGLGVTILLHESGGPALVVGSSSEVGQAVLNLLVNALDALEERGKGGRVDVEVRREADESVIVVSDDGPGVPAAQLERVSDLFYTTKEVGKGTGLGLALVHNIARAHGGSVRLSSTPGDGFRVELHFPSGGGPS